MSSVFADANYWIALLNHRDQMHAAAVAASEKLAGQTVVTSHMVLVEVLNSLCEFGPHTRAKVAQFCREISIEPSVELVEQTATQFASALQLFQSRPDKAWSLTDCASFLIMRDAGITQALTHDAHFAQMGFVALMRAD